MFRDTFLDAAAGSTSRELRISRPTLEMVSVTTTAMAVVKMACDKCTGMPREDAN